MNYFIYIIIGWGVTDILVNGSIFDPLRFYLSVKFPAGSKILTCIRCSGFWVGILSGIIYSTFILPNELDIYGKIITVFSSGALISGSSVFINAMMIFLLKSSKK
jgi:hypothetical protein